MTDEHSTLEVTMVRTLTVLTLLALLSGCATPYAQVQLETSNDQVQSREEVGVTDRRGDHGRLDGYLYHESDPRNGFRGDGWPRETENGVGVRYRHTFDGN